MSISHAQCCPRCRYDLTGLPTSHTCPECGLHYDDNTRIWRPGLDWRHYFAGYGGGGLVLGFVLYCIGVCAGAQPAILEAVMCMFLPAITLLIAMLVQWLRLGRISNRFVAITGSGLLISLRGENRMVAFDRITSVGGNHRRALLRLRDAALPLTLDYVFESEAEFVRFQTKLRAAIDQGSP